MSELTRGQKIFLHVRSIQNYIKKEENRIQMEMNSEKFSNILKSRYHELHTNYPSIYERVTKPLEDAELDTLKYILRKYDDVVTNQETGHEASVEIGENLYNKYVKNLVKDEETK